MISCKISALLYFFMIKLWKENEGGHVNENLWKIIHLNQELDGKKSERTFKEFVFISLNLEQNFRNFYILKYMERKVSSKKM